MIDEIKINKENLLGTCGKIKETYDYLTFITAVDYPDKNIIEMIYHLQSLENKKVLMIKVELQREKTEMPSVSSLWPAAEWHEREVFDLFGVRFSGHPDLRRILLTPNWEGHPLLKDYSKTGIIKRPETIK